jgi:hypothetical protein
MASLVGGLYVKWEISFIFDEDFDGVNNALGEDGGGPF